MRHEYVNEKKSMIKCWLRVLFVSLMVSFAQSGISQVIKKDSKMVDQPKSKTSVAEVKKGELVKILKRKGFWFQVESKGKKGWVKATVVKFNKKSGSVALDTGRMGKGNIVSTSAARGLSAKDLVSGKPNTKELEKFAQFFASGAEIDTFASSGKLSPVTKKIVLRAPPVQKKTKAESPPRKVKKSNKAETVEEEDDDEW